MSRLEPNYWFLGMFIICITIFISITDNFLSATFGVLSIVSLGWMMVFGKYNLNKK